MGYQNKIHAVAVTYLHMRNNIGIFSAVLLMMLGSSIANSESLPCSEKLARAAVPQDVFYLPESDAMQLNDALNKHGAVRLDPAGDYSRAFTIKLKANQELYGLAGTKVPNIIILEGAKNVVVSDIHNEKIIFPPSEIVTSNNCFNRVRTSITIKNTKLENNLFTDFQGGTINIDNSKAGYIRNNRFIKTMTHTAWPALTIRGNIKEPSYGNHFVWTNILGPQGDAVVIDNQRDIAFTGIDIESWSWGKAGKNRVPIFYPAAFNVSNTSFLSIFMSHGGNHRIKNAQYFNLDAKYIFLQGMFIEPQAVPGLVLGENVEQLLAVNTNEIGHKAVSKGTQIIELFKDDEPRMTRGFGVEDINKFPSEQQSAISNILKQEKMIFEDWDKPQFGVIPGRVDLGNAGNLRVHMNASDMIQSLVNQQNIAKLEAGIYILSKPIELKDGQGILGDGQEKTILIANDKSMDLIVGASHIDTDLNSTWFVLADLTLQGGRNGIHHAPAGSGGGAQYHRSVLSHVTFRGMSNAAIYLDSIYAWDNNFLDNINFVDCGTGIMQRPNALYKGGDVPGTTYMDKNVCYRCRFENNAMALDMPGKRGNGLNAFIDSQFKHNGKVLSAIHPLSNFFANSTFIDNQGDPSFETNKPLGFVNADFIQTIPGSLFQRHTLCNNCSFNVQGKESKIFANKEEQKTDLNFFINTNLDPEHSKDIYSGAIIKAPDNDASEPLGLFIKNYHATPLFN